MVLCVGWRMLLQPLLPFRGTGLSTYPSLHRGDPWGAGSQPYPAPSLHPWRGAKPAGACQGHGGLCKVSVSPARAGSAPSTLPQSQVPKAFLCQYWGFFLVGEVTRPGTLMPQFPLAVLGAISCPLGATEVPGAGGAAGIGDAAVEPGEVATSR